jgi:hypothetical protein
VIVDPMVNRATVVLGVLLAASVLASASSATVPKKWYWSESRAEALVVAHVKIPSCAIWPDDPGCDATGRPNDTTSVIRADCQGASEYKSSFTYPRFVCKVITYNNNAEGRIAVYVVGRTTFHWKILG